MHISLHLGKMGHNLKLLEISVALQKWHSFATHTKSVFAVVHLSYQKIKHTLGYLRIEEFQTSLDIPFFMNDTKLYVLHTKAL